MRSGGRSKSKSETSKRVWPLFGVGGHLHPDDLVGIAWRLALLQGIDKFHARGDAAPDRVLLIKECCISKADEELAVGRIRAGRASHGANATDMRLLAEFGLEVWFF